MTTITLDRETSARVRGATGRVSFLDPDGAPLLEADLPDPARGNADGFWSEEDLAEALRRRDEPGPRHTREEVWARILAEHGRPDEVRP